MAESFGASFAPLDRQPGDSVGPTDDVQRAIQVLNLRIPRFEGARGILPLPLLGASPSFGGGVPYSAVIESLLRQLAAARGPAFPSPAAPSIPPHLGGPPSGPNVAQQAQAQSQPPLPRFRFTDDSSLVPSGPSGGGSRSIPPPVVNRTNQVPTQQAPQRTAPATQGMPMQQPIAQPMPASPLPQINVGGFGGGFNYGTPNPMWNPMDGGPMFI